VTTQTLPTHDVVDTRRLKVNDHMQTQYLLRCKCCRREKWRRESDVRRAADTGRGILCKSCQQLATRDKPSPKFPECCGGMPWRVVGPKCRGCGLKYGKEPQASQLTGWERNSSGEVWWV